MYIELSDRAFVLFFFKRNLLCFSYLLALWPWPLSLPKHQQLSASETYMAIRQALWNEGEWFILIWRLEAESAPCLSSKGIQALWEECNSLRILFLAFAAGREEGLKANAPAFRPLYILVQCLFKPYSRLVVISIPLAYSKIFNRSRYLFHRRRSSPNSSQGDEQQRSVADR